MNAQPILWDREFALAAIRSLLDDVTAGRGRSLFIVGEAGLGKTSILDRACDRAGAAAMACGVGRGDAMEAALPFAVVGQVFTRLGGAAVFEADRAQLDQADARSSLFSSVLRWLSDAGNPPLLLVVDDLHWADPDSMALLSFVCRRLESLSVGVLGAMRPYPPAAHEVAATLAHDGFASVIDLPPLSPAAARELLDTCSGRQLADEEVMNAWEISAGNPLLLEQVGRVVARGDDVPRPRDTGTTTSEHLLLARFAGLSAPAMRCAQAASVFGTRFRAGLALRLAQLVDDDADAAFEALSRSGLVREARDGGLEFVHPLFRQALYDDLGAPVRTLLHARAFSLLCEQGHDAEAAEHALRGDLSGDPAVVALLARVAAAALQAAAVETASALYAATVDFAGDEAPASVLLDYAHTLVLDHQAAKSITVSQQLLNRPDLDALTRAKALRSVARGFVYTGATEAAISHYDESVATSTETDPDFATDTLLEQVDYTWFLCGPAATLDVGRRGQDVAEGCSPAIRERFDSVVRAMSIETGDGSRFDESATRAHALEIDSSASALDTCHHWGPLVTYGTVAKLCGHLADAQHAYDVALHASEQLGASSYRTFIRINYVDTLARQLRVDEALELLRRSEEDAALAAAAAPFHAAARALLLQLAGRLDECDATVDAMEPVVSLLGAWLASLWFSYLRGWRLVVEGRPDDACAIYAEMEATMLRVGAGEPCEVPWAGHALAAYVATGRVHDASRVIGWLEKQAEGLPCRWPRIAAATGRARLAEAAGDHESAENLFQRAVHLHEEVDIPLERVQTLLEYGKYLRRAGQPARARPLLAEALQMAEDGGAAWIAAQAQDELHIAGGRRRRARGEPTRLTPQEERVAWLAATGATTKQIADQLYVSTSTIDTHLEHIYSKLGIHSRRELMAMGSRTNDKE